MAPKKRKTSIDEEIPRQRQKFSRYDFRFEAFEYTNVEQKAIDVVVKLLYDGQTNIDVKDHNSKQIQHGVLLLLAGWIAVILEEGYNGVIRVINEDLRDGMPRLRKVCDLLRLGGYDVWLDISIHDGLIPLAAVTNLLMNDHVNQPVQESMDTLTKLIRFYEQWPDNFSAYYNTNVHIPLDTVDRIAKARMRLDTLLDLDEFGKFDKHLEVASITFFKKQHSTRKDFVIVTSIQPLNLLEKTVKNYIKAGKHTILWYVERKSDPAHAQLLLINTIKKEVVMFDPHGSIAEPDDSEIKRIVNRMGYRYVSTAGRCFGNLQENEQSFAYLCTDKLKTRRTEGFCFAWQLVIADVAIRIPDHSYLEVDKELEKIVQKHLCDRLDTITHIIRNISALA